MEVGEIAKTFILKDQVTQIDEQESGGWAQ